MDQKFEEDRQRGEVPQQEQFQLASLPQSQGNIMLLNNILNLISRRFTPLKLWRIFIASDIFFLCLVKAPRTLHVYLLTFLGIKTVFKD